MLAALPLLSFVLILLLLRLHGGRFLPPGQPAGARRSASRSAGAAPDQPPLDWRRSFLAATVIWGCVVWLITESFSAVSALDARWVAGSWLMVCAITLALLLRAPARLGAATQRIASTGESRLGIAAIAVPLLIVGVIAAVAAPNDTDSMKYHLMRVVHWVQDGNVGGFPAEYLPQIYQPPWAEYVLLHLQLLSGGDRLANLVQWFAFAGTAVAVSAIAAQLGAGLRGQLFAAAMSATIPVGILQASTAQNACVATFWIVCSVHYFLSYRSASSGPTVALLGASAGLAILTKGTAYIFLAPFAIWWLILVLRRRDAAAWKSAAAIVALVALLNAPSLARNASLFGQPLGPEGSLYVSQTFAPGALISGLVRNLALHAGTPNAGFNHALEQDIDRLHTALGIAPSDPRTTWLNHQFHVNPFSTRESTAGNPVHLALILGSFLLLAVGRSFRRSVAGPYAVAVVAGFVLFCFALKWQPWNSRLQLPFFSLACPVCGLVLARSRWVAAALASILLAMAVPFLFSAETRPVFGAQSIFTTARIDQYFSALPQVERGYRSAAARVAALHCTRVGFAWGGLQYRFEYPLWIALRQQIAGVRVEDIVSDNVSARLETTDRFATLHPCAVLGVAVPGTASVRYHGTTYGYTRRWGLVKLYLPAPS